ncbi:MAG: ABC transporter ATP-binding protein [Egibacteraceae bacterium]
MRIRVADVSVELDSTPILSDVALEIEPGEFVGLLGPNGSGKSTLLRTIYRALRPVLGTVRVGGDDVWRLSARASARRTAVVVQESAADFDFEVFDVVSLGRNPHKGTLERDTVDDERICLDALKRVGMEGFAARDFQTLSGGEKQRVYVARAIAQESRVLVLDEPTNHLDIRFQLDLLDLVRGLGVTTIAAMHDLALAAAHCDRVYVLEDGAVVAAGAPRDVLDAELVARVFGVRLCDWTDPASGQAHLSFERLPARNGQHNRSLAYRSEGSP